MKGENIMKKNYIYIQKAQKKNMMTCEKFFYTQDKKISIGWNMIA